MLKKSILILLVLTVTWLSPGLSALAVAVTFYEVNKDFNPNNLIADAVVEDYNSMTLEQIKEFVVNQGGTLATYIDPHMVMPAYWIIWNTAQEFKINPKFILTMLQKEQSLVTDPAPTQNQYNWAVGYSCYGGICLDKYKGFSTQIRSMANKFINDYLADLKITGKYKNNFFCTFTKWCVGDAKQTQDYQLIIPQNRITAALYTYNPYQGGTVVDGYKVGANYNFWKIWSRWFAQTTFRPSGALVKAENSATVYLIQNGQKRPFSSFSVLVTRYDSSNIVTVSMDELNQYEDGPAIKFAQYSLLSNAEGDIYLLVDDTLKHIASMEVFRTLGFNPEEIQQVAAQDLSGFKLGEDITLSSSYPTGALIKDVLSGGVYYVRSGLKYPIFSKEILNLNFPGQKVIKAAGDELDKYPKGEAIKFKDSALIKSTDSDLVYVISDGKKLLLADEKAFVSRGYLWSKVITTSQAAVDIHPTGPVLEFLDSSLIPKIGNFASDDLEALSDDTAIVEELQDFSHIVE